MDNVAIVIPSRMGSTRLPNKPLADIAGKTMIARVISQARLCGYKNIIVAAPEEEILQEATNNGALACLTDASLPSGSDRILQALNKIDENKKFEIVVNLQGDLPNIHPSLITASIDLFKQIQDADITTLGFEIDNSKAQSPDVVKIVGSANKKGEGAALYFSRSPVPYGAQTFYEHVGIYCYRRQALERFVSLEPSRLEKLEKLEQLRALENGMKIYFKIIQDNYPISVDTQEDLEQARLFFEKQ